MQFYCSFFADVRTLYNKTVLFYFYFSFIAAALCDLELLKKVFKIRGERLRYSETKCTFRLRDSHRPTAGRPLPCGLRHDLACPRLQERHVIGSSVQPSVRPSVR